MAPGRIFFSLGGGGNVHRQILLLEGGSGSGTPGRFGYVHQTCSLPSRTHAHVKTPHVTNQVEKWVRLVPSEIDCSDPRQRLRGSLISRPSFCSAFLRWRLTPKARTHTHTHTQLVKVILIVIGNKAREDGTLTILGENVAAVLAGLSCIIARENDRPKPEKTTGLSCIVSLRFFFHA